MPLPFSIQEFLEVFRNYNTAVWPAQILLVVVALVAVFLAFKRYKYSGKAIVFILAFLWLWVGVVYHILFFSAINKVAYIFGALFILQGLIFLYLGIKNKIGFSFEKDTYSILSVIFIVYALIIYHVLNYVFGHGWPYNPTFGLPCPTVIFTFAMLMLSASRIRWYVLLIPLLWALIGVSAAINLHIWEDVVLVIAGIVGSVMILYKNRTFLKEN